MIFKIKSNAQNKLKNLANWVSFEKTLTIKAIIITFVDIAFVICASLILTYGKYWRESKSRKLVNFHFPTIKIFLLSLNKIVGNNLCHILGFIKEMHI